MRRGGRAPRKEEGKAAFQPRRPLRSGDTTRARPRGTQVRVAGDSRGPPRSESGRKAWGSLRPAPENAVATYITSKDWTSEGAPGPAPRTGVGRGGGGEQEKPQILTRNRR